MKDNPEHATQNPDEPALPGEVERDNDALRPNDPAKRKQQEGNPAAGETDAQKTGRHDVTPSYPSNGKSDV
ncbi:hypothetical protein E3Z27_18215 [Pseudomonas mediterranea]|jgi:hypothetical protein|uniref:Uncharacterized protein n=1 Tax=Pseudomonas mediterranea TaxID=183795 RepID=A0AAX2DDV1_9PSED|nr:hypothetical protein [Pseudomonas mediterranea]KGU85921.1 hypothetical protein N005_07675 [Pseudomonas mediterranea CFBP 5447]MBL0843083.1 hypothetical protein [Pseudomonas mediterranea]MDU9028801.1 hypothetical protein [Pseudomonas mediterranea]QHA83485.1 hypothetical protein E3Z27_18215 [Pseudomonas mediterranea]UZD99316.1 hypothetical protein LOY71_17395 [Pseudomonas mediterranea]